MKRVLMVVPITLALVAAACTSNGGSDNPSASGGSSGPVQLTMWMGYTPPPPENQAFENISLNKIVDAWNAANPNVHVNVTYVNSDNALTKLQTALQGDQQPDITYQYGTNMPQVAYVSQGRRSDEPRAGRGLQLGRLLPRRARRRHRRRQGDRDPGARRQPRRRLQQGPVRAGQPHGADARLDVGRLRRTTRRRSRRSLEATYSASRSRPTAARRPCGSTRRCCGRRAATILNSDNTQAAFNSPEGVRALTVLQQLQQANALYLDFNPDAGRSENLFNSGNIGMIITGPWDLSSFPDVNYGVQVMPSFDAGGSHQTIAGPDNWVIMDNGPERVDASWDVPEVPHRAAADPARTRWPPATCRRASSVAAGSRRSSASTRSTPASGRSSTTSRTCRRHGRRSTQYPQISAALGQAVANVLLGKGEPQAELDNAAQTANGALAAP